MFNIGPTLGPVSLMRLRPKLLFMAILMWRSTRLLLWRTGPLR
jgi:hypothetical protein